MEVEMKRVKCVSSFAIDVDPTRALDLFTPEGERLWAGSDWDPAYPVALEQGATGAERGIVFETGEEADPTIWVAVEMRESQVSYARVRPGSEAGIVSVRCLPTGEGGTEVEVTYETTSLSESADRELDGFAEGYAEFIASWKDELSSSAVLSTS